MARALAALIRIEASCLSEGALEVTLRVPVRKSREVIWYKELRVARGKDGRKGAREEKEEPCAEQRSQKSCPNARRGNACQSPVLAT